MLRSFQQFKVKFFAEFSLPFVELEEDLVVHHVVGEELVLGKGPLVGHRSGIYLPVLAGVLQLHF